MWALFSPEILQVGAVKGLKGTVTSLVHDITDTRLPDTKWQGSQPCFSTFTFRHPVLTNHDEMEKTAVSHSCWNSPFHFFPCEMPFTQKSNPHGHVFATFQHPFLTYHDLTAKTAVNVFFNSIPVATAPYNSFLVRSPLRFSMIDWHCDSVPAYLFHSLRVVRILVRVETQSQLNRKEN